MALLDKLFGKGKQTKPQSIEIKDSNSLGDIAVKLAKSGMVSVPKDKNHNTFGDSLDKLDNGELPWGWVSAKADFIRPRDDKLCSLSVNASKATSIDEEIALLKELIAYYYEYRKECISMGECYFKYFSDMHMHCHNSKNKDFEFVAPAEERLKYIQENYEKLVQEQQTKADNEAKKQSLLNGINLCTELENTIRSQAGILQSDLYKTFDPLLKDEISLMLYEWTKSGKITREKSGRSYKLYWSR